MIVSMLCYTRSHHANRLQKLFAVYLKFRGLSAKAFDTLHALTIVMSHKWTANHVAKLSAASMKEVKEMMALFPWLISYDNINIPFRVFSQRLDSKDTFSSGVAATVYIKRHAIQLTPSINKDLQELRALGMENPITPEEIFDIDHAAYPRIHRQAIYQVLHVVLNSPEFQLQTYQHRDSPLLLPPPPIIALPCGRDHITLQYIIGSINIPEASYADNERVLNEILSMLDLKESPEGECHLASDKLIAWLGDQLMIDRLRGLFKYRSQDINSFDRLDWMILMFGWLHLQMAFANSLHLQYLGTSAGRGLSQAFNLLGRKGLTTISTRGPFHHHLEEILYHVAEAHIWLDWLVVAGISDLSELRGCSAEGLIQLAERVVNEHASSEAMEAIDAQPEDEQDKVKRQTILWTRDVLHYIVLDNAIKHGNVGIMEDMLPTLLF